MGEINPRKPGETFAIRIRPLDARIIGKGSKKHTWGMTLLNGETLNGERTRKNMCMPHPERSTSARFTFPGLRNNLRLPNPR